MLTREKHIDIIKGIAIFLVLWGHCIQSIAGDEGFFSNWVIRIIYSFHMPLFMVMSGYLFQRTSQKDFFDYFEGEIDCAGNSIHYMESFTLPSEMYIYTYEHAPFCV